MRSGCWSWCCNSPSRAGSSILSWIRSQRPPAAFDAALPGPPEREAADLGGRQPVARIGAEPIRPLGQPARTQCVEDLGEVLVATKIAEVHAIDLHAQVGAEAHGLGDGASGGVCSAGQYVGRCKHREGVIDAWRLGAGALEHIDRTLWLVVQEKSQPGDNAVAGRQARVDRAVRAGANGAADASDVLGAEVVVAVDDDLDDARVVA